MIDKESVRLRKSVYATLVFIGILWSVKIFEVAFGYDLGVYGILPRTLKGSIGIITGPLLHGDIYHLLSNTFPILILGIGIIYFYNKIAVEVIALIYLMTGFWVWVAARDAYHIGASGLVYGLLSFLLISGFIRRDSRTLAISFVVFFLYGSSLFAGFAPTTDNVSWESHILGAVAGVFCAVYFRNANPGYLQVITKQKNYLQEEDYDGVTDLWRYERSIEGINFNYQLKHKDGQGPHQESQEEKKTTYTITLKTDKDTES